MGFNSWKDFNAFEKNVKYKNRFIHSDEVSEFLANIKRTLPQRERSFPIGGILYRSQKGFVEHESEGQILVCGYPVDRMKPAPFKGREGRANPKGISYLYLSNDMDTSLAELRPNVGQLISLAHFKAMKNLRLVDCYSVPKHYSYVECIFNEPKSQDEISNAIWSMINVAFTKPVSNEENSSDYVPTQVLSEYFKAQGYDGICFKSGMGAGHNFILFNLDHAEQVSCTVMETKSINYQFEQCGNPGYVLKK